MRKNEILRKEKKNLILRGENEKKMKREVKMKI